MPFQKGFILKFGQIGSRSDVECSTVCFIFVSVLFVLSFVLKVSETMNDLLSETHNACKCGITIAIANPNHLNFTVAPETYSNIPP